MFCNNGCKHSVYVASLIVNSRLQLNIYNIFTLYDCYMFAKYQQRWFKGNENNQFAPLAWKRNILQYLFRQVIFQEICSSVTSKCNVKQYWPLHYISQFGLIKYSLEFTLALFNHYKQSPTLVLRADTFLN